MVWRVKELAVPLLYIYDLTLFICDTSTYEQISCVKDAQIVRYCCVTRSFDDTFLKPHLVWQNDSTFMFIPECNV